MQPKKTGLSLRNLSVQFSLIVIGIPTLMLMGFGFYQVRSQTIALEKRLDTKLRNEATQLSASLSTALFNFDDDTCRVICRAALEKPEIVGITILDMNEVYLRFTEDNASGVGPSAEEKVVKTPITFKTENIGTLEIVATTRLLSQQLAVLKKSIILQILILDLVLAAVMALVLLIRFVRPLKALQKGSERIAAGDLDYPIDVGRKDELGALAANLLTMRDAVREKVASLEAEVRRHEQTSVTLKKTKSYIDDILNSMPSILISVDPLLTVTQWNIQAEAFKGLAASRAVGRPLMEMVPELAPLKQSILSTMESREIFFKGKEPRAQGQGVVYEDITVYPLTSKYGEGAVIRVDDVTEHVRLEQMMVQSEKMMSVGGLAAGMAHEINNPLAGMMQNAQVILRRITEDMPASIQAAEEAGTSLAAVRTFMEKRGIARQLESIHHAGTRAAQIVQNMLSFARKDYSGKSLHNIIEILDQTVELANSDYDLKKQYDFKSIEIVREYEEKVPRVSCEASKIQQVFFNILKNCAEAMQDPTASSGPDRPRIILRVFHEKAFLVIEIQDNGPGMDEGVRKRVFEPFFTTKPVGKGTGLGLSVSYFIITDNHKGKMNVVSSAGRGSRFIIHLPLD